jgi:electron transport complex protein RnfB
MSGRSSNEYVSTATTMAETKSAIFVVDEDLCYGCGACIALCPTNALDLVNRLAIVKQSDCTLCEHCIPSCPVFALRIEEVK